MLGPFEKWRLMISVKIIGIKMIQLIIDRRTMEVMMMMTIIVRSKTWILMMASVMEVKILFVIVIDYRKVDSTNNKMIVNCIFKKLVRYSFVYFRLNRMFFLSYFSHISGHQASIFTMNFMNDKENYFVSIQNVIQ